MFIRLTRLDNTPIWINASFVVTVEPRKAGGSVVVPIGDGLDYDVKETPEAVLSLLGDAPAPAVVPVPPPPGLAPKTLGVASEAEPMPVATPNAEPVAESAPAPAKKTTRTRAKAKASAPAAETEAATAEAASDDKPPAKKPRARRTKKPVLPLTEDEVARLRKLAPGTVRKLQNTLVAQFRAVEPEAAIVALEAHEILTIDRDHIVWK